MSRPRTKKFEYGKGIFYFNIRKGFNNNITIKRLDKKVAVDAYKHYLKTQPENCDWLGKWDGKKFTEDNFEKVEAEFAE